MMAASVSTRVVSWKEAAEMNESVDRMLGNTQQVGDPQDLAFARNSVIGVEHHGTLNLLPLM